MRWRSSGRFAQARSKKAARWSRAAYSNAASNISASDFSDERMLGDAGIHGDMRNSNGKGIRQRRKIFDPFCEKISHD